ncbi:MAG: hypothetical protein NWE88_07570 [Candidatus Bathyarchaeota archaeon]|nr:hypothetical protein [Candidatus Bathyarchaeota archaeon]
MSLGSHVTYFEIEGLEENSMPLTRFEAAKSIRTRSHELFEAALETGKSPEVPICGGGFSFMLEKM